jgi:hypothetical protein
MAARFSFNVDIGSRAEALSKKAEKIEHLEQEEFEQEETVKQEEKSLTPEQIAHRKRQQQMIEKHRKQKLSPHKRAGWMGR